MKKSTAKVFLILTLIITSLTAIIFGLNKHSTHYASIDLTDFLNSRYY